MFARLLALLLLAATFAAAAAPAPAPLLQTPADWEALLCAALVALYVARRRSHWLAD